MSAKTRIVYDGIDREITPYIIRKSFSGAKTRVAEGEHAIESQRMTIVIYQDTLPIILGRKDIIIKHYLNHEDTEPYFWGFLKKSAATDGTEAEFTFYNAVEADTFMDKVSLGGSAAQADEDTQLLTITWTLEQWIEWLSEKLFLETGVTMEVFPNLIPTVSGHFSLAGWEPTWEYQSVDEDAEEMFAFNLTNIFGTNVDMYSRIGIFWYYEGDDLFLYIVRAYALTDYNVDDDDHLTYSSFAMRSIKFRVINVINLVPFPLESDEPVFFDDDVPEGGLPEEWQSAAQNAREAYNNLFTDVGETSMDIDTGHYSSSMVRLNQTDELSNPVSIAPDNLEWIRISYSGTIILNDLQKIIPNQRTEDYPNYYIQVDFQEVYTELRQLYDMICIPDTGKVLLSGIFNIEHEIFAVDGDELDKYVPGDDPDIDTNVTIGEFFLKDNNPIKIALIEAYKNRGDSILRERIYTYHGSGIPQLNNEMVIDGNSENLIITNIQPDFINEKWAITVVKLANEE